MPDLAGWRRERLPEVPEAPYLELAPDGVCEVLSPSTAALDRGEKREVYQRERVPWFWIVEPRGSTLEVLELDGPTYRLVDVFAGGAKVRARPFDAIELDLALSWASSPLIFGPRPGIPLRGLADDPWKSPTGAGENQWAAR